MKFCSPGSKLLLTACVALLCLSLQQAKAQRRPVTYTQTLSGLEGSLVKDSSRTVIDSIFFDKNAFDPVDTTTQVNNMIVFYIDETSLRLPPDSFKVDLDIRIYFANKDSVYDSIASRTLTLEYSKIKPYNSKSIYLFKDARSVKIKVLDIVANHTTLANILPMLKVENRMAIGRIFSMDCENDAITTVSTNTDLIATKGELQVSWPSLNAAEEYDLEWTFVDQTALDAGWYSPGGILDPNRLFRNNATRVTISKNFYLIPLLYEGDGKLFYRVRAAQNTIDGERKVTDWSSDHAGTGGLGEYTFTGHEPSLNWQASTSFAEEGKRKSVVQYFDGTLRNRQTVTKDNATDTTIVAETFYDKQGRSQIQVLPAPSLTTLIKYNPLFNQGYVSSTAVEYDQSRYDTLQNAEDYCVDHAPPLATVSGTSKYYSSQNQNKNELIHRYIPDAEMYPFTEVKYTQDNTGRIASQGGVGPLFQLNSGHETKYYYGTPSQQELDALFGTEAGYASHYQKNMVRDANGQYSVSYVDMHGRTVATALAGDTTGLKLEALPSYRATTQTDQLLTRNNNIVKGQNIESTSGLLVTMAGSHTFNYILDAESLKLADKDNVDICYDCLYDVTITVTDDCNNQNMPGDTAYVHRVNNMRVAPPLYDTTCDNTAGNFTFNFSLLLPPGSYIITKKLTLREDAMNWYRDSLYTPHNTVKTKEQIIAEQLELIRAQRGSDCVQEGEPWYEYQQYREQMLLDMTPPFGQYAIYPRSGTNNIYSIFTGRFVLGFPTRYEYNFQKVSYPSDPLAKFMSPERFANNFQPEWAESLLRLHPEYGILQEYEKMKPSFHWDADFEATSTYAAAAAKGYLNPLNSATSPASGFSNGNDSLFYGGTNSTIKNGLKNSMETYVSKDGTSFNLWTLASIMGRCDPEDVSCVNVFKNTLSNAFSTTLMCEGERDMAWRFFRDQYLRLKRKAIADYINTKVPRPEITAPATRVFVTESMAHDLGGAFFSDDAGTALSAGNDSTTAMAKRSCENYVSYWWSQLSACNYSSVDSLKLIPRLIEICKGGADSTHPFGASSIGPKSSYRDFSSFDELITHYNDSIGKPNNAACNAFLIDKPVPYSKPIALVDQPWYSRPDDATCDRIASLRAQYNASTGYSSFSDFLQQRFNTTISDADLNRLDSLCKGTFGCKFTTSPIIIPPVLQPTTGEGVCVDCNQVNTVYNSYKATFPGNIPTFEEVSESQQQTNQLFKNYMNSKLGFSKTALEYLQFLDTCGSTMSTPCDSLQNLILNYDSTYNYLSPFPSKPHDVQGCDTTAWKFGHNDSFIPIQLSQIVQGDGYFKPINVNNGDTTSYSCIHFADSTCLDTSKWVFETRFKIPREGHFWRYPYWISEHTRYGGSFTIGFGNWQVDLFFFYEMSNDTPRVIFSRWSPSEYIRMPLPHTFDDFVKVKMVADSGKMKLYYDDIFIGQVSSLPLEKWRHFYIQPFAKSMVVDYVKVYDGKNRLLLNEEFSNCTKMSHLTGSTCPVTDCEANFANYFNQQKGTSYTYNQIDSIYYATCGKRLDVCADTSISSLNKIVDDFKDSKIACAPESWTIVPSNSINKWTNYISNGITSIADSVRDQNSPGVSFQHNIPYPNSLTGKDFTVETRMRIIRNDTSAFNPNLQFVLRTDSTYINVLFWQPGNGSYWGPRLIGGAYDFEYPGFTTHVYPVPSLIREFQDWAIFKVEVLNDSVHNIYFNDILVLQLPFHGKINTLKNVSFFTGAFGDTEFEDINFDYIKIYDSDGSIIDYVGFDCQENCQERFENYFNQKKGTNYNYAQIDSIYTANGLVLTVCNTDTSAVRQDQLEKYINEYKSQYLQPSTGYVDLDMRTFAGNKTPDEGPKGVFDVKGKLLGNTVDSTLTAIKHSYVNIWNSSADNREVGTLSLLQNGKFRLTLNAGKSAPCQGIIGQRYYQVDAYTNLFDGVISGTGTYIDFGDSTGTYVNNLESTSKTVTGSITGDTLQKVYPDPNIYHRYYTKHSYENNPTHKTVTIYHSDFKGVVAFDCFSPENCAIYSNIKNIRGFFPQELFEIYFHTSHDSTLHSFSKIRNFNQITSLEFLSFSGHISTGFRNNTFPDFSLNRSLREIAIENDATLPPSQIRPISEYLPDLPTNFPNLNAIVIRPFDSSFTKNLNFQIPGLRLLAIQNAWISSNYILTSSKIDEMLTQVANGTQFTNGVVQILPHNPGSGGVTRSSASDAAVSALTAKNWRLIGAGLNNDVPHTIYRIPVPPDTTNWYTPFSDFINSKLGTNLTAQQIDSLYLAKCGHKPVTCPTVDTSLRQDLLLCGKNEATSQTLSYDDIYDPPCSDSSVLAYNSGTEIYNAYKDSLDQSFNSKYAAKCLGAASIESFTVEHPVSEYHYTLYYYDQAGNLVKTVAPAGVNPIRRQGWLDTVALKRGAGQEWIPSHDMPTVHRYNSLNQVVSQKTPDAGKSTNWYDRLGRLAVSQNAQQLIDGKYSYTVYDHLSRITEVGQKPQPTAMTNTISRNPTSLFDWIYFNNGSNTYGAEMVTRTVYDEPSIDATPCVEALRFTQKSHTLRNRVSFTRYFEKPSYAYNAQWAKYFITGISYTTGIDYSYDIHGNVDTMRNLYGSNTYSPMTHHGANACKTIAYHYDLISGKVNEVHYQPGQNDEFYHRYEYDAENRLIDVYTADNKIFLYQQGLEEHEAKYQYYKHGPLARTILGQQQVQGIDYIYTLQGWLKGINGSDSESPNFDAGNDGKVGAPNQYVADDLNDITLRYFMGDYKSINSAAPNLFPAYEYKLEPGKYRPLYNGNISAMTTDVGGYSTLLYNYTYDQLNRLVVMDTYRGFNATSNNWNSMIPTHHHKERYTYDGNGNILTVSRNGNLTASQLMDSLYYHYEPGTNRLEYIDDYGPTVYGTNVDIKDQSPGNYQYDANGNLKSSVFRLTNSIKWNVYGKIVEVLKGAFANAGSRQIYYNYDPSGNRVGQSHRFGTGGGTYYNYTWYVRDAQGNVMAVYKVEDAANASAGTLKLTEHHMYGSSRLGIFNRDQDADQPKHTADNANNNLGTAYLINFTRGNKFFELTNHLGNVMGVISDKKLPETYAGTPLMVTSYSTDNISYMDYSPFGMALPGRIYNNQWLKYRYGFNGKDMPSEMMGPYNEYDYGMRVYDPRVGRFLSVDPLTRDYPFLTPYQYASNRPIDGVDLDGLEYLPTIPKWERTEAGGLLDYVTEFDNAIIGLINLPMTTWNSGVKNVQELRKGTWTKTVSSEIKQMGKGFSDLGKQFANAPLTTLTSPEAFGFYTEMFIGGKVFNIGGKPGNLIKPTKSVPDIALGLNEPLPIGPPRSLKRFADQTLSFEHTKWKDIFGTVATPSENGGFGSIFTNVMDHVTANKGVAKFDLTNFKMSEAIQDIGKDAASSKSLTNFEFNTIMGNKKYLDATQFYKDGKLIDTKKVVAEYESVKATK